MSRMAKASPPSAPFSNHSRALCVVCRRPLAAIIEKTNIGRGARVASVGGLFEPFPRRSVVLRYALALKVQQPNIAHSDGVGVLVGMFEGRFEPYPRHLVVLRHALAVFIENAEIAHA